MPCVLGQLLNLRTLDLEGNQLSGAIPPPELAQLRCGNEGMGNVLPEAPSDSRSGAPNCRLTWRAVWPSPI